MRSRLKKYLLLLTGFTILIYSCKTETSNTLELDSNFTTKSQDSIIYEPKGNFKAWKTSLPIVINGSNNDAIWKDSSWYAMNYNWIGQPTDSADYDGKFKLAWDHDYLYILVAITDDYLQPTLKDGIANYWKGDYVEVFIDENRSGGDHKFNHSAFAYHVSTEGHAIDLSKEGTPVFLDDHIKVARTNLGNQYLWELAIALYPENEGVALKNTLPRKLQAQQSIGFSIAYGDNDGKQVRENFTGSKQFHGINNDQGYTNADVFGTVLLVE
jgi:hypothetical protein